MKTKIDKKIEEKIYELYDGCMPINEIAGILKVHKTTVNKYITNANLKVVDPELSKKTAKRMTIEQKNKAIEKYKNGISVEQIAEDLKFSKQAIHRLIKVNQIKKGNKEEELLKNAMNEFKNGIKATDLIEKYGFTKSKFYRELKKQKID